MVHHDSRNRDERQAEGKARVASLGAQALQLVRESRLCDWERVKGADMANPSGHDVVEGCTRTQYFYCGKNSRNSVFIGRDWRAQPKHVELYHLIVRKDDTDSLEWKEGEAFGSAYGVIDDRFEAVYRKCEGDAAEATLTNQFDVMNPERRWHINPESQDKHGAKSIDYRALMGRWVVYVSQVQFSGITDSVTEYRVHLRPVHDEKARQIDVPPELAEKLFLHADAIVKASAKKT